MWTLEKPWRRKKSYVESVKELRYNLMMVGVGGGCLAAVNARTRCERVMLRECGDLLYERRIPLWLKGAVYKSYVRPAILYGSEAWCLLESEMVILWRMERSTVRAMCGVQLMGRKRAKDLMLVMGLDKTNLTTVITTVIITASSNGHYYRYYYYQIWRLSLLPLLLLPDLATVIITGSGNCHYYRYYYYLIWRLSLLPLLLLPDLVTVITTIIIITGSGDCHYYRYYYYQIWWLSLLQDLPTVITTVIIITWSGDCHYYRYYYYKIWRLSLLPLLLLPDLATVITTVTIITRSCDCHY